MALSEWSHHHDYLGHEDLFLYISSVYSCHLFLISSASVRSLPFLFFIEPILEWNVSLGISNLLEEISSLSQSLVFLYFFALITEEGFLISPCYSLDSAFRWVYLSFCPLLFTSLLFTAVCKASSEQPFYFFAFIFHGNGLDPLSCTMSWTFILEGTYLSEK